MVITNHTQLSLFLMTVAQITGTSFIPALVFFFFGISAPSSLHATATTSPD